MPIIREPHPHPGGRACRPTAGQRDETRRAAFLALVAAQDEGNTVKSSRELVARRFGLREDHVRAIEREGIANQWPPLNAGAG